MSKFGFYHIKTLFQTYIVWAVLNLLPAWMLCIAAHKSLISLPWIWAWLHIMPLWFLMSDWWHGGISMVIFAVMAIVAGLSIVAALLVNRRWARFLIVISMSIWFLDAFCIIGMGT